ncbi:MAG: hypothetical protein HY762_03410 [Planctomycetes bacterium]|nr:hypothetical protein [Planctomycetota bacterium]
MNTDFIGRTSRIPPTAAIGAAMVHTKKMLFQPFNAIKWLKFGIVAFLVGLAGGNNYNFNFNLPGGDRGNPPDWAGQIPQWIDWCKEHLALIIAIGIAVLIVITVIWTVFLYLSSRFIFVYMDGVVNNDMRIKEYYKANRANGWSYFMWRMGFIGVALPVILVALVPLGLSIFFIAQKGWIAGLILLLIGSILFFFAILVLLAIISMLTTDFVLPIMSLLKIKSLKAWGVLWTLMKGDRKTFLLYILLKIALGIAAVFLDICDSDDSTDRVICLGNEDTHALYPDCPAGDCYWRCVRSSVQYNHLADNGFLPLLFAHRIGRIRGRVRQHQPLLNHRYKRYQICVHLCLSVVKSHRSPAGMSAIASWRK